MTGWRCSDCQAGNGRKTVQVDVGGRGPRRSYVVVGHQLKHLEERNICQDLDQT